MSDWVVVPVKSIANGKSRLAPILGRPRRRRLNQDLLARTLNLAARVVDKSRIILASQCVEARTTAAAVGAVALREPRGVGLNRALDLARRHAVSRGATGVLVLPSDLPMASLADLRRVTRAGTNDSAVVICRDRHGRGTNALYLKRVSNFRFRFGENSAAAHVAEAAAHGMTAICVVSDRLGFDLDTPDDYRDLAKLARCSPVTLARQCAPSNDRVRSKSALSN